MSSSPTAATSTTASSTSWPSPAETSSPAPTLRSPGRAEVALIACGAIAQPCAEAVARHDWPVDVHPLPPLLHNQPQLIAVQVEELADRLAADYHTVAVGYADCGTYGALDELCTRRGLRRLEGLHCYDLYAGARQMQQVFEEEPGTYVLTDFLVRSFERTVITELGLDRHPELHDDYFGHYRRVVWLRQQRDPSLASQAQAAAARLGLPLEVVDTGQERLDAALAR